MPWLLRTDCIENKWFNSPDDVPGGYAILSHVWGEDEQTFQDTPRLPKGCDETERPLSYHASDKIREFCRVARRDGYQWAWADTCCIDKSSSAELSEAINSMYEYYALARVCYVILVDVRHRDRQPNALTDDDDRKEFRESKWHTRGWTLQELLAPDIVIFLDADWHVIGTKSQLAHILARVTGIPEDVLRLKTELTDVSIAGRMSWASKRKTTRVEDEAYCLMGIFGINMPTLYGEGRAAFTRLQEEIMKQSPDTSLFVWGEYGFSDWHDLSSYQHTSHGPDSGLLAPAPSAFSERINVRFAPDQRPEGVPSLLPTFVPSAHGILSHVPVVKLGSRVVGALLLCIDDDKFNSVLILTECSDTRSPQGPLYDVGGMQGSEHCRISLFDVSHNSFETQGLTVEWEHIYIAHRPPSRAANPHLRLLNHALFPSLRIPHPLPILYRETASTLCQSSASNGNILVLARMYRYLDSYLALRVGRCTSSTDPRGPSGGVSWTRLSYHWSAPSASDWYPDDHDCSQDHISDWVRPVSDRSNVLFTKRFRLGAGWNAQYLGLSFSPSPHDPNLLVLTEILLSEQRPDDSEDVNEVYLYSDIFWRRVKLNAFGAASTGVDVQGQWGDGSSSSPSKSEASRRSDDNDNGDNDGDDDDDDNSDNENDNENNNENEQPSRVKDEQHGHDGTRSGRVSHTHSPEARLSCPDSPWVEQDDAVDNANDSLKPVEATTSESVDEHPLSVDDRASGGDGDVEHGDGQASIGDVGEDEQARGADERQARGTRGQLNEHTASHTRPSRPRSPCAGSKRNVGSAGPGPRDVASIVATNAQSLGERDDVGDLHAEGTTTRSRKRTGTTTGLAQTETRRKRRRLGTGSALRQHTPSSEGSGPSGTKSPGTLDQA